MSDSVARRLDEPNGLETHAGYHGLSEELYREPVRMEPVDYTAVYITDIFTTRWDLGEDTAARLLCDGDLEAYRRLRDEIRTGLPFTMHDLSEQQRDRASYLVGIHYAMSALFLDVEDGCAWLRAKNVDRPFEGRSPIEYVLNDPSSGLPALRAYLEYWHDG